MRTLGMAMAMIALAACSGEASGNPIIGSWALDSGPPEVCGLTLGFTADSQEVHYPNPANDEHHPATYNASPRVVYVMHNEPQPTKYDFAGRDSMSWTGPRETCSYHRQGTAPRPAAQAAANPVLGDWTLIEPAAKGCYARLSLATSGVTGVDAEGEKWPMPGTAAVNANRATYTGSAGDQVYSLAGDGTLANGNPPCRYRRG